MAISRREFLYGSATAFFSASFSGQLARASGNDKKVLIMGGGVAGLCAAYELQKAGCEVIVFEQRPIPGGRIMSLREPFADNQVAEAGAMILATKVIEDYVSEFGLPTVPVDMGAIMSAAYFLRGQRITADEQRKYHWPIGVKDDEQGLGRNELLAKYWYGPIAKSRESLTLADFPFKQLPEMDQVTLADFWREQGASEAAIEIMTIGYFDGVGDGPETYSALSAMTDVVGFRSQTMTAPPFQIAGGNDLLPGAFAERLGEAVQYSSPVLAIDQNDEGVKVMIQRAEGQHQVKGDFLVCATPLNVLHKIQLPTTWPDWRRQAYAKIKTTSITRTFLQFRERFWEAAGRSPAARTDLPIQGVNGMATRQPGERGILESFAGGAKARTIGAMSDDDAIEFVLTEMSKVHPEAPEYFETGAIVRWDTEPGLYGCQAWFKPGQMHAYFPRLAEPEGRIHFAGDHVGGVPGYAFAALLSGQKAALDILESV